MPDFVSRYLINLYVVWKYDFEYIYRKLEHMQKKFMLAAVVVATGLILTAYAFTTKQQPSEEVTTEQAAAPANHCDPADCTPDKAKTCPYSEANSASATAQKDCPATTDCPPSTCKPKSETQSL